MNRERGNQQQLVKHSGTDNNGKPLLLSIGLKIKAKVWVSELTLLIGKSHPSTNTDFGVVLLTCQNISLKGGNWGNKDPCLFTPSLKLLPVTNSTHLDSKGQGPS